MAEQSVLDPTAIVTPAAVGQDAALAACIDPALQVCRADAAISPAASACEARPVLDAKVATDAKAATSAPLGPEALMVVALRAVLKELGDSQLAQRAARSLQSVFEDHSDRRTRVGAAVADLMAPGPDPFGLPVGLRQLGVVSAALDDVVDEAPLPFFVAGVFGGFATGAGEWVASTVKEQVAGLGGLLEVVGEMSDAYQAMLDPGMWVAFLEGLLDGDPEAETVAFIKQYHPYGWHLYEQGAAFVQAVRELATKLRAEGLSGVLAEWIESLAATLAQALRAVLQSIVDADGHPNRQGNIIGSLFAKVLLELVWIAVGVAFAVEGALTALAKGGEPLYLAAEAEVASVVEAETQALRAAAAVAVDASGEASVVVGTAPAAVTTIVPTSETLDAALAGAKRAAKGIATDGAAEAVTAQRELTKAYGAFSEMIAPDRVTVQWTAKWRDAVQKLTGLTKHDLQYALNLRLDSAHIVDRRWIKDSRFQSQFKKAFTDWKVLDSKGQPVMRKGKPLVLTWETGEDMDTIAIHTSSHIRSGTKTAENLARTGAEGVDPMATQVRNFFKDHYLKEGGKVREFKDVADIVRGHRTYWATEQKLIYEKRLDAWFQRAEEACRAAGFGLDLPEWVPPGSTRPPRP